VPAGERGSNTLQVLVLFTYRVFIPIAGAVLVLKAEEYCTFSVPVLVPVPEVENCIPYQITAHQNVTVALAAASI